MSELVTPFQTMSLSRTLPPTDTPEGRIQLSLDYLRDPQATALRALTLTPEDLAVTLNIAYNPPPDVTALQRFSCNIGGDIQMYFYYAILSMKEHYDDAAAEARRGINSDNSRIIEATRAFLTTVPEDLKIEESAYTISNRLLDQLLPVARRAVDLLREPENDSVAAAYLELRSAATTFIHHFKLPSLFCDALGLALEVFLGRQLSRHGVPPRVHITGPGPQNPILFPFVYHSGVVKEVVGVFDHPRDLPFGAPTDHLILLRSASRNPSHPELQVFELELYTRFPGILEECKQESTALFLFSQTGQIDRWRGKRWSDFRILGVASTPNSYRGCKSTFIFAESTDGSITAEWWHEDECNRKFGAPKVQPSIYIHKSKTGQINKEDEHYVAMHCQLGIIEEERGRIEWHSMEI